MAAGTLNCREHTMSLILAMTGRSAALADLSGAGLDTLKSRSQE